jgi:transposase InsO family protein
VGAWENAVAETFCATLKRELIEPRAWPTRKGLHPAVFDYIEGWYNVRRLHSSVDCCSPAAWKLFIARPTASRHHQLKRLSVEPDQTRPASGT